MELYPHQRKGAEIVAKKLREYGIFVLAWEERTGKTLTFLTAANLSNFKDVLVVSKLSALEGIQKAVESLSGCSEFELINYQSVHKAKRSNYDMVVLDEFHGFLSGSPKTGVFWKRIKKLSSGAPLLFVSATPHPQGYHSLFNPFALCDASPWSRYSNFYQWFKAYGKPYTMTINGQDVNKYDRCKEQKIIDETKHLFYTATRAELGFEHEPEDVVHYVKLEKSTRKVYNQLLDDELIVNIEGTGLDLVCDSVMKLRTSLHMLEGGGAKVTVGKKQHNIQLPNTEKIDFIKKKFGDKKKVAIMYQYQVEGDKLRQHFKKAAILQGTKYAEGVDLSHFRHLIIYSQDFSTARHTQRRARQANKMRKKPILVHFILVKGAISSEVYRTVSKNKQNYVDSLFARERI